MICKSALCSQRWVKLWHCGNKGTMPWSVEMNKPQRHENLLRPRMKTIFNKNFRRILVWNWKTERNKVEPHIKFALCPVLFHQKEYTSWKTTSAPPPLPFRFQDFQPVSTRQIKFLLWLNHIFSSIDMQIDHEPRRIAFRKFLSVII